MERVDWDALQEYQKSALERVSTLTGQVTKKAEQTADTTTKKAK